MNIFIIYSINCFVIEVYLRLNKNLKILVRKCLGWSCRSMVDRKITGLEVAGSSPVTITFYHPKFCKELLADGVF